MKNNVTHTTFRNGDLFCTHCGDSHKMPIPIAVDKMSKLIQSFNLRHAKCPKTWIEPDVKEAQQLSTMREKMLWWINNGEHGISSKTIYSVISHDFLLSARDFSHPHDPDDFRRCYLLLKAVPEFKAMLFKMKPISKQWSNLVDNWDKLTEMLEEQMSSKKDNGMYEFMQQLTTNQ